MSITYLYLVIERKRKYLLFVSINYKVTIGFKYINWCFTKYVDVDSGYMHSYINKIASLQLTYTHLRCVHYAYNLCTIYI